MFCAGTKHKTQISRFVKHTACLETLVYQKILTVYGILGIYCYHGFQDYDQQKTDVVVVVHKLPTYVS